MAIEKCSHDDYLLIIKDLPSFWGSDRTAKFHHPMFVHEFRNTSYVVREEGRILAYLFGFNSQIGELGYIHLAATREEARGLGYARSLYDHFFSVMRESGKLRIKVVTSPENEASIAFHEHLGFERIELARDYAGPGADRVILEKEL